MTAVSADRAVTTVTTAAVITMPHPAATTRQGGRGRRDRRDHVIAVTAVTDVTDVNGREPATPP